MGRNNQEKTIEGDLFQAFVAADAISKANADDPKKSSFVRCARTDKGVHAAGNLISLKLIVEDPDIVAKINEKLPPQIRVWGIERTNGSFNCYQLCDSRIYEYLVPTYCFLPPHPKSFLGKQILELAEQENDLDGYNARQDEVKGFWQTTDEDYLKPVIESIDSSIREEVLRRFYGLGHPTVTFSKPREKGAPQDPSEELETSIDDVPEQDQLKKQEDDVEPIPNALAEKRVPDSVDEALRALKFAHNTAKRAWRIPKARLNRTRSTLSCFVGSIKYHNYTIDKTWKDPSAMRVIKSFDVTDEPIIIGGTEWLSLKVHGQSFMMHQIRKMVSAAALVVRCGCHEGRLQDTYLKDRLSIPKAPSLGLLLERPIFDKYNEKLADFGREKIDFAKHDKEIQDFKNREIYQRIFEIEEKEGHFLAFFAGLDSTRSTSLLWASSAGLQGLQKEIGMHHGTGTDAPDDIKQIEEDDEPGAQEDN